MNLEDITLSEVSQPRKESYSLTRDNVIETENRMVAARDKRKGGIESYCSVGIELQFYKIKRAVGMDGGDGRTTL